MVRRGCSVLLCLARVSGALLAHPSEELERCGPHPSALTGGDGAIERDDLGRLQVMVIQTSGLLAVNFTSRTPAGL